MKVGLVDVDGRVIRGTKRNGQRFPNLALMKLSAWHKAQGDEVEFAVPLKRYDRIYKAKVFTFTKEEPVAWMADEVIGGGTGYDLQNKLPDEVEHMMPDYSLYGVTDTAYGFMSRGCPRGCPFCVVAEKEGRASRKVADLREWWDGQKRIELMDPNTIACPDWRDILGQLADCKAKVNINQGADIRLMTEEKAEALRRVRLDGIHFAWDRHSQDLEPTLRKYVPFFKHLFSGHRARVYVLVNYESTHEEDLHRIRVIDDMGYDPFVMVYDKEHAPLLTRKLARWCNNKAVFRKCRKFEDYNR